MQYLKLQAGQPVTCEFIKYIGPKEKEYEGRRSTAHAYSLKLNGAPIEWEATEIAHNNMGKLDLKEGTMITIAKIFDKGKNYINVDIAGDAMATMFYNKKGGQQATVVDQDERQKQIIRQSTTSYAINYFQGKDKRPEEILQMAKYFENYVLTGEIPGVKVESKAEPSKEPGLDDLPFN